jgi:hypothetical protein
MKAIKAKGIVQPDHKVLLQLTGDIAPGEHVFILVVEDSAHPVGLTHANQPIQIADDISKAWPEGFLKQFSGALHMTDLEAPEDPLPEPLDAF